MWAICKKELRQFFSSLTGYIAIIVFLLLNGLLLFIFPQTDILSFGYATLDKFFELAPWILLFLIPAITMRMLSDEFRMGTLETLLTSPLGRGQLVVGKYLASLVVVLIALLPTLLYFLCIQWLAGPGGIDTGATVGSYIGLVFLAAVFTAIGIWCSSFTSNAVVAFIIAAFACFLFYSGFNAISGLPGFSAGPDYYIQMLGIDFHYRSISRGVIDLRDLLYFLSIIVFFLFLTRRHLAVRGHGGPSTKVSAGAPQDSTSQPAASHSPASPTSSTISGMSRSRAKGWGTVLGAVLLVIIINLLGSGLHQRIDLTKEKRYTLSESTKQLLARVDDDIQVDFFLEGDLKAGIRKLAKSTTDLLDQFNEYCGGRIRVHTFDPLAKLDDTTKAAFLDSLNRLGIQTYTQVAQLKKGEESQRLIIAGAILRYHDKITAVSLLKGVKSGKQEDPEEQKYENAETLLEFKFGSAIDKITRTKVPAIGYVLGNGEPLDYQVYDLIEGLRHDYRFGILRLDSLPLIPLDFNAIVIVKPTRKFTEREKISLDQYVIHGGKIIWAIDNLYAEMDSLQMDHQTIAYDRGLELEDLFFKYGVRVNEDLVEDRQCASLNMVVGMQGDKPQFNLLPWPYFPLLNGSATHPISKNLDPVYSRFANSIDTVKATGITKTVLLQSSENARTISTPALISFESMKMASDPRFFNRADIPVAILLEGRFNSLYANRISQSLADSLSNFYRQPFLPAAETPSAVIVCADADIFMNEVTPRGPLQLGFSKDLNYPFANKEFVENCFEYLVNPSHILDTRSKDFTLRMLDPSRVEDQRTTWQFINIGLPLILVILFGYLYQFVRRRSYQA
jgi:ABC-2 type transport system permease protein